jgi:pSer/pThr/pTyr-binding forkhead associated (FHA) protein
VFKLVISDDEGKTTVVPLVRDEITIGRKEGNTIRLTERNVSRRHAKLLKGNGAFRIEDLQSYNGVKVNGRKIDGHIDLKAGDQIGIGDYLLALQLDAGDQAKTTAAVQAPGTAEAATAMIAAPGAEPIPPARLVMLSPPAPGAEFALSKPKLRVGRAEDLDAWVNHRSISREHAEVVREGDRYKVVDLGSANGVRVNGQEVSAAPLNPGDVLELGQVKFRFVGEGETYVFDADRTIQMEAIEAGEGMPKAPILAALGIVGAAVVVAAIFALSGTDETVEGPVNIVDVSSPETTEAAEPAGAVGVSALQRCRDALAEERWADAVSFGESAVMAEVEGAAACRDEAREGQALAEAVSLFGDGHTARAYATLEQIGEASPRRQETAYNRIMGAHLLAQARDAPDADSAIELAEQVLDLPSPLSEDREVARRLIEDRRPRVASAPAPTPRRNPERASMRSAPQESTSVMAAAEPAGTGGAGGSLQDCRVGDASYNRCVIRALEGRARSANDLALLIETYRNLGNQGAAMRHMVTFVRRYPTHGRAQGYQQILAARGVDYAP